MSGEFVFVRCGFGYAPCGGSAYRTDSALLLVGAVLVCPIFCRCGHDFYATDGFAAGIDDNKRVLRPKTLFAVIESDRV